MTISHDQMLLLNKMETRLKKRVETFMQEQRKQLHEHSEDYKDVTVDDFELWFVEWDAPIGDADD